MPASLTQLTLGILFNKSIDNLPKSLTKLELNCSLAFNKIPNSITHLTFGYYFDEIVDDLPNSITHLTFGSNFNQPVNNLPNSITDLVFGNKFNQPVDKLPFSLNSYNLTDSESVNNNAGNLKRLVFGKNFNQNVDNLPNSIKYLTFGKDFNQNINKYPDSLIVVEFFSGSVNVKNIPDYVKTLKLNFNSHYLDLVNNIPIHITKIKIIDEYFLQFINKIPFGCEITKFNNEILF